MAAMSNQIQVLLHVHYVSITKSAISNVSINFVVETLVESLVANEPAPVAEFAARLASLAERMPSGHILQVPVSDLPVSSDLGKVAFSCVFLY